MTTIRKEVLRLTIFLIAAAPLAPAQGTYTQFDVPGALGTVGAGIDTAGDIVGSYGDSSGNQYGFLFNGGTYTTITYPGSVSTTLDGINDGGQIVGITRNPNTGFLYDVAAQTFTAINHPHASFTLPFAINNVGTVGGTALYGVSRQIGFELVGSQYKAISPPRTSTSGVEGVTTTGTLFGTASAGRGSINFSFSQGKYTQFQIPDAPGAAIVGVNPAGTALVGYYNPSSGVTAGFLYQNKTLTELQFPGSTFTQAYGINANGEAVGVFVGSDTNTHGFTWTPSAEPHD